MTLSPLARAALVACLSLGLCLALAPHAPWVMKWPEAWTLPVTDWVGRAAGGLEALKPLARALSSALTPLMEAARSLLQATPWPLMIGAVTGLALATGGARLAVGAALGLGFVLASGYWEPGMVTLSLVIVSVPLALVAGAVIGIAAHELPRVRGPVEALLDIMQTVPTFAYLTPLLVLFGFGPVVGLIASAIYAAPPMARNVLLALDRTPPELREAAIMAGTTRAQQLRLIELPAARGQIMAGVNQTIMAALSMVIIAAVIGGFDDIGWAVLLTMRKADFGNSLVAGLVITLFAILIDRIGAALARDRRHWRLALLPLALGAALSFLPTPSAQLGGLASGLNDGLGAFTASHGATLDTLRNGAMYYGLLPLRIGLAQAVLPMTWGFQWSAWHTAALLGAATLAGLLLRKSPGLALMPLLVALILLTGIADLPWPFVLVSATALGQAAGGPRLALLGLLAWSAILLSGLWAPALLSVYLSGAAVLACALVGGALGAASAASPALWRLVEPLCDILQTIPAFVFLIPVLMVFQIGEFSAFLAICTYAVVPMIRYTRQGLAETPDEMIEAATASGATAAQIFAEIRAPQAVPQILLGLNQTILAAFSMLVIAALIGTTDLGQQIYLALGQADVGLGLTSGAAMVLIALWTDRLVRAFAAGRRAALGL